MTVTSQSFCLCNADGYPSFIMVSGIHILFISIVVNCLQYGLDTILYCKYRFWFSLLCAGIKI